MTKRPVSQHWSVDKKIPVALIVTLVVQTAGIVWWGATTSARINVLEQKAETAAPQGERLTRVEVKVDNIIESMSEIKQILRKNRP